MEKALLDIAEQLKTVEYLDDRALTKIINRHNKRITEKVKTDHLLDSSPTEHVSHLSLSSIDGKETADPSTNGQLNRSLDSTGAKANPTRPLSKRHLIAYYLDVKRNDPERWKKWGFSEEIQQRIVRTLQMKPRRTASGVATITVLTKPWKCSSNCSYCPNDLRMPKSYLSDEPACQRAERTFFDPYLQVTARIKALTEMGHVTDKIELIVLGGTWSDYPLAYQIWFIKELFRALNDGIDGQNKGKDLHQRYENASISNDPDTLAKQVESLQKRILDQELSYNQAFDLYYGMSASWQSASEWQKATWKELELQHRINETTQHRVVGLVIETRPERITPYHALVLRRLGCTKVQMGIQSLDETVRKANKRYTTNAQIQSAFETLRLFGFKTHVHTMVNLMGSDPERDKKDYLELVNGIAYQPDEIKLYPCVLIGGTELCNHYQDGTWRPYSQDELVDILVADTCATPSFTRISRMIRDFSAPDIIAGNKKVNLRQLVERKIDEKGLATKEIRHREVSLSDTDPADLKMEVISYTTTATDERFLQWIDPEGKIAGFLRLSLPHTEAIEKLSTALSAQPEIAMVKIPEIGEAMIREVHVYGRVARLTKQGKGAQHHGLGTQLIERACEIAREAGYIHINVISAIGTRRYYQKLHFYNNGLYQRRDL